VMRGGRLLKLFGVKRRGQEPHRGLVCLEREGPTSQVFDTLKSQYANGLRSSCIGKIRKGGGDGDIAAESVKSRP
jgi:hypothetical protein